MIDNIKLFKLSIKNKEPYIDKYYAKNNTPIITDDSKNLNDLMRANIEILENISAYKIASESKNKAMQNTILKNIVLRLNVVGINFSEFTSFWATKDVSYSIYENTLKTEALKIEFLKKIIPEYLKDRHALYQNHGYSASTLQVVNDSKAHKENGNSGSAKIADIFSAAGFKYFDSDDFGLFAKSKKIFIYPDKTNRALFKTILKSYNIKFDWSKNHENKQTDFLFKVSKNIYIMEHKHMKETGGGQDKQMSEIINFISYKDKNVCYISFLDGIYFNLLSDIKIKNGKPFEQRSSIIANLKKNKQNYFVNTFGFSRLIMDIKK